MVEYGWDETSSENYLEILEQIYGPIGLHAEQNIEEVNLEWMEVFSDLSAPETDWLEGAWTEQYLEVFEGVYGELIPPVYDDIETINAEWVQLFYTGDTLEYDWNHAA